MAGTTFIFLLLLGIAALWLGRAYGHNHTLKVIPESDEGYTFSERATALWALTCLLALVPIGIVGLRLWLR